MAHGVLTTRIHSETVGVPILRCELWTQHGHIQSFGQLSLAPRWIGFLTRLAVNYPQPAFRQRQDPNCEDADGHPAILVAAAVGSREILEMLLKEMGLSKAMVYAMIIIKYRYSSLLITN